jgi:hypothetical protein
MKKKESPFRGDTRFTMTMKQEISKSILRRWIFAVVPFVLVGLIDLIRAWHKGDLADAIMVCLIFFIAAPCLSIRWHKQDWTHQ